MEPICLLCWHQAPSSSVLMVHAFPQHFKTLDTHYMLQVFSPDTGRGEFLQRL
jgi:hypothetical protein